MNCKLCGSKKVRFLRRNVSEEATTDYYQCLDCDFFFHWETFKNLNKIRDSQILNFKKSGDD